MMDEPKQEQGNRKLSRRQLMKSAVAAGLLMPGAAPAVHPPRAQTASNRIAAENQLPGTTDWQLTYVLSRDYRSKAIEGYCSRTSARPGESIDFFVSAEPATEAVIDLYRLGYYGGKGGRYMTQLGPFRVRSQPDPPFSEHRLRECRWERTTRLTIPDNWLSGLYLGKLSCQAHRYQSYVIFIVRDDRQADLLFQCSDTTWQAYNKWPDSYSLYDSDPPRQALNARTWVSFDRPYGKYPQVVDQPLSQGSGEFLLWEFPLCFWLEKSGYDVSYWSNLDTHSDRQGLKRVKALISVGHDEYWSLDMFNHVKNAVDDGLSVAFLSGNTMMWVIDFKPSSEPDPTVLDTRTGLTRSGQRIPVRLSSSGQPNRIFYRAGRFGGLLPEEAETRIMGPFPIVGPNENTLIGARTTYPFNGSADWIVSRAEHWIFEGTGMKNGDAIPGLVGWEFHGDPADIPGLEVVATGKTINTAGKENIYAATVYPGPKGNWVFNASTIFWSIALADPPGLVPPYSHHGRPHGPDERVQRITANFLAKCGVAPRLEP